MPIQLGPTFDTALLTLAGIDPATVDPGTVEVSTLNPGGSTTIRACIAVQVDTADLAALISDALPN